jgi:hypothetical protein
VQVVNSLTGDQICAFELAMTAAVRDAKQKIWEAEGMTHYFACELLLGDALLPDNDILAAWRKNDTEDRTMYLCCAQVEACTSFTAEGSTSGPIGSCQSCHLSYKHHTACTRFAHSGRRKQIDGRKRDECKNCRLYDHQHKACDHFQKDMMSDSFPAQRGTRKGKPQYVCKHCGLVDGEH